MKKNFASLFVLFFTLANLVAFYIFSYLLNINFLNLKYIIVFLFFYGLSIHIYHNYNIFLIKLSYYLVILWFGIICNSILLFFLLYPFGFNNNFVLTLFIVLQVPLFITELYLAYYPKTVRYDLNSKNLPKSWNGLKILHISDLHLGPIYYLAFFNKLCKKIEKLKPDIIFITGDFVNGQDIDFSWLQKYSNVFDVRLGSYFVFGNHDLDFGKDKLSDLLSSLNIQVLENQKVLVNNVSIVGLESSYRKKLNIKKIFKDLNLSQKDSKIVLLHEPSYINTFQELGVSLQLSGHTHGGQVFPFNLVARLFYKYLYGFFKINDFYLSLSSGIGASGPPLRLGTRSELVLIRVNC